LCLGLLGLALAANAVEMPCLQKNHGAWQLLVDGQPFLNHEGKPQILTFNWP
jgi:hypothetical protein